MILNIRLPELYQPHHYSKFSHCNTSNAGCDMVLKLEMEVELVLKLCSSFFFLQILTSACESFLLDILKTESSVQNEKIRMFISIDFLFFVFSKFSELMVRISALALALLNVWLFWCLASMPCPSICSVCLSI